MDAKPNMTDEEAKELAKKKTRKVQRDFEKKIRSLKSRRPRLRSNLSRR